MSTNNNPKVSVIIPSYNHANFVGRAIESVLNQTFQDFELIIADDCSPDNSVEIIEKYNDPRIRFYKFEKNKGAVYTTNFCISKSQGKYIALLNSDDMWELTKLEKQVAILDRNKEIGVVFTDAMFINETEKVLDKKDFFWADVFEQKNRSRGQWLKRFFFELNCLCHPSILIRKEIYDKTNLYNFALRQLPDFSMWINVLKLTSIHIIEEKLVKFRIFSSLENASADTLVNKIRNKNEIFLIMQRFFDSMPLEVFKEGFSEFFLKTGELTEKELICEQAFIFFKPTSEISHIYKLIGIDKLYNLLQDEEMRVVLERSYNFTENNFFEMTGKFEIIDSSERTITNVVMENAKKQLTKSNRVYSKVRAIYKRIIKN